MASSSNYFSSFSRASLPLLFFFFLLLLLHSDASAKLSTDFYAQSCPQVFDTVKSVVKSAINQEKRIGASLLRLLFHDCFVLGCDASVLLDDTSTLLGEKTAKPNNNSLRGFEVVDRIKTAVEKVCPGVVSCADILAITARDSVVFLNGPSWEVKLGRRDSRKASFNKANTDIPPPTSSLANLTAAYAKKGLSVKDLVALSGAHTIGKARCISFRDHIYNDTDINGSFAKLRQANCPRTSGSGDDNLAPLDLQTPTVFDNDYFNNLISFKGLLHSDQELYNTSGSSSAALVKSYSRSTAAFFDGFVAAMIKMSDIRPLTGKRGEIRKNCRKVN
ncbi:peroxidase 4-like [Zingiber officinale]|uniref:peroxidase 4-like n=1 Tax=Zingiber officinale TaxID=94328 RepID=UPI001C4B7769|nr:peroxidase 4-like [Zingiber officinale]